MHGLAAKLKSIFQKKFCQGSEHFRGQNFSEEKDECLLGINEDRKGNLSQVTFSLKTTGTCTCVSRETRFCPLDKLRLQFLLHSDYNLLYTGCVHLLIFLALIITFLL